MLKDLPATFLLVFLKIKSLQKPEAVAQRCFVKKVFLKISQNSQENSYASVSFLIKLQAWGSCNFIKKETLSEVFSCEFCELTPAQVFPCKLCEISKNTFFHRTPPVAASKKLFWFSRKSKSRFLDIQI